MYVLALMEVYLPAHINVKSLSTPARTLAASRELVRLAAGLCARRKSVDAQAIDQPSCWLCSIPSLAYNECNPSRSVALLWAPFAALADGSMALTG